MLSHREENYLKVLDTAKAVLLNSKLKERCWIAGAEWNPSEEGGIIALPYFHLTCRITIPQGEFSFCQAEEKINLANQILILHYLNGVKDISLKDRLISFKEIPSGEFYYPAFARRSIEPLVKVFGSRPDVFQAAGEKLGGERVKQGDVGLRIRVFPKVPVTLVLWSGDKEFFPDFHILFDASITEFFSTEDIAVLSQEVMIRMIKASL